MDITVPLSYFPQTVFIMDMFGVPNEYIERNKRTANKSYHP